MDRLEAVSFERLPDDIGQLVSYLYFGFGGTKVVENSFRELRHQEQAAGANKNLSRQRRWQDVITKKLLSESGFREIRVCGSSLLDPAVQQPTAPTHNIPHLHGPRRFPACTFEIPKSDPPDIPLQGITEKGRLDHIAQNAQSMSATAGALAMLLDLHANDSWKLLQEKRPPLWKHHLLLFNCVFREIATGDFLLSLGYLGPGAAVLGWPLQPFSWQHNGLAYQAFQLDSATGPRFMVDLGMTKYHGIPTKVVGPVTLATLQAPKHSSMAVMHLQTDAAMPVLEFAAQMSFRDLTKSTLRILSDYLQVPEPLDGKIDHANHIYALVCAALQKSANQDPSKPPDLDTKRRALKALQAAAADLAAAAPETNILDDIDLSEVLNERDEAELTKERDVWHLDKEEAARRHAAHNLRRTANLVSRGPAKPLTPNPAPSPEQKKQKHEKKNARRARSSSSSRSASAGSSSSSSSNNSSSPKPEPKAKAKGKAKAQAPSPGDHWQAPTMPARGEEWTADSATAWAPIECKVRIDDQQGRFVSAWTASSSHKSKSVSWYRLGSKTRALKLLLRECWSLSGQKAPSSHKWIYLDLKEEEDERHQDKDSDAPAADTLASGTAKRPVAHTPASSSSSSSKGNPSSGTAAPSTKRQKQS